MQLAQVSAARHWNFRCICQWRCSLLCGRLFNNRRYNLLLDFIGLQGSLAGCRRS